MVKVAKDKQQTNRRGRIIVRNLSFKATDKKVRDHFAKFGEIEEVNIPKKSDGKLSGYAFVQYTRTNDATKAIREMFGKKFMDRPVALDWAIPKDTYVQHLKGNKNAVKKEEAEIKEEDIKSESEDNDVEENDLEAEPENNDEDGDDDDDDDEYDGTEEEEEDLNESVKVERPKPKMVSNDVSENKTIFIRNIPYDAKDNDLRDAFIQYGQIEYSRIVIRQDTKHSAGTGFVKFKTTESVDLCLANKEHSIMNQMVYPHLALSRDEVKKKGDEKEADKKKKCTRNLYLLKEGLILSGTSAAIDVSVADMARRLELEKTRNERIKNFSTFVSDSRLTIHNLPPTWDTKKLREMIVRETKLRPIECRVMLSNQTTVEFPHGVSKCYAYVGFKGHDEGLTFLRTINNNPNIFGKNKRPIVAFSIESKHVVELKKRRYEEALKHSNNQGKKKPKKFNDEKKQTTAATPFSGITVNSKNTSNIRTNRRINQERRAHLEHHTKNKSEMKSQRKNKERIRNIKKKVQVKTLHQNVAKQTGKVKVNKKLGQTDHLDTIVQKYKRYLNKGDGAAAEPPKKKGKWYKQ